jgi:hypothetical protein
VHEEDNGTMQSLFLKLVQGDLFLFLNYARVGREDIRILESCYGTIHVPSKGPT